MITLSLIFFIICISNTNAKHYDSFTGQTISKREYNQHVKSNTTFWCTNEIELCDPYEGRRLDGSCNNLEHPSRGTRHTPLYHVLPLNFDKDYNARKSKNGEDKPLSRVVRTTLLAEGRAPDPEFTHLLTYFLLYVSADILSFHDSLNYLIWTACCQGDGKPDPQCVEVKIPDDDPVHRFTKHRCLNLTHPWTFQSTGCIKKKSKPERIITATPHFDLSQLYTDDNKVSVQKSRMLSGGLLKYEVENGRIWPPSFKQNNTICVLNNVPKETRCHDTGEESINGILGTNLFTIWFWRHHNYIATELAKINPCWSDDKLFETAKDINIATAMQMYYYELIPLLLGLNNLIQDNVLSPSLGFRDNYDENILPQTSSEYGLVLRWAHTMQEGVAKMYDTEGKYVKSVKVVDLTLRTGYLSLENNIDYITQGAFRQATGKIDGIVDFDIAERGFGNTQQITDITTSDLEKNRLFGIAPYIKYREICFGEKINTFEDLLQAIDPDKIELLRELYTHVEDIDLLAGVWVERPIAGARVPATFYCLVSEQLARSAASDRHWYERRDRPRAFTIEQLLEIRKTSIAGFMCEIGDKVTEIQPNAFQIPGQGNEVRSCNEIPKVNLYAWKEEQCRRNV